MIVLLNYIGLYELEREREREERIVIYLLSILVNKFKVVENINFFMFVISYDK